MGLASFFDRVFRVRRIVDPVFGFIRYQKTGRFWEGAVLFAPTGGRVDVYVDADEEGPTEAQRGFLLRLADRYPDLHAAILARGEEGRPLPEALSLVVIDVPENAAEGSCELTYESADGVRHVTVDVSGWAPAAVHVVEDG